MTSWVRLWSDMPTDPKWRAIARRCGARVTEVIAVWSMMMVHAGKDESRGTLNGWSDEDAAAALDMDEEQVAGIRTAMQGKVLDGNALSGWEKRQPKREDDSRKRVQEHRERERAKAETPRNDDVTHGNAPDSEADTDIGSSLRSEPSSPAVAGDAAEPPSSSKPDDDWPRDYREQFWARYPRRVGKDAALRKLDAIRRSRRVTWAALVAGIDAYVRHKPPDIDFCHPATWLNAGRWQDEHDTGRGPHAQSPKHSGKSASFGRLVAAFDHVAGAGHDGSVSQDTDAASPSERGGTLLDFEADPRTGTFR